MTPCYVRLASRGGYLHPAVYRLNFRQDGFWPQERLLMADPNPWVLADIRLPLSPVWIMGVDGVNGARWRLPRRFAAALDLRPARKETATP